MSDQNTTLQDNSSCVGELDTYLADSSASNCLQFWRENIHKYARLYQLHLKYHCIPATSAAMERCFSAAGYIVNARRSRLSDQMLELLGATRTFWSDNADNWDTLRLLLWFVFTRQIWNLWFERHCIRLKFNRQAVRMILSVHCDCVMFYVLPVFQLKLIIILD